MNCEAGVRKGRTARDKIQSAYNAYAKQMVTDDLKRYFAANINYHYNSVIKWRSIAGAIFAIYTSVLIIIIYQGVK